MPANGNRPKGEDDEAEDGALGPMLARAEAAIADLAKDYSIWALADVARARTVLDAANADAANRAAHIEALFRVGHDLKGQGSSFGYPLITKLGHSLCALTRDRARDYDGRHLDLARSHLDAMHLVLTKEIKGDGGKVGADLIAKLESKVVDLL
jgi:hypothetical protein